MNGARPEAARELGDPYTPDRVSGWVEYAIAKEVLLGNAAGPVAVM